MSMPIEHDGMSDDISLSMDDAGEAFLKTLLPPDKKTDADTPSDAGDEEARKRKRTETEPDESDDEPSKEAKRPAEESDDDGDEDEGHTDEETERKFAEDGVYVKVKVGDEEHEVQIKDLQRLYGQEAALTKKSMEVADRRKALDNEAAKTSAVLGVMIERANARAQQFANIDFLALSRDPNISNEELTALRQEAQDAFDNVRFLNSELGSFMEHVNARHQADLNERAIAAIQELSAPPEKGGIEGWGTKLYDDIRSYAVSNGAPRDIVNNLVDPWAIRMLHKSMLFDRGAQKVQTSKKVDKSPRKVVKTTSRPQSKSESGDKVKAANERLSRTGSTDDAAEAFLARWGSRDDE